MAGVPPGSGWGTSLTTMALGPLGTGWGSSLNEMAGAQPSPGWGISLTTMIGGSSVVWVGKLCGRNGRVSTGAWRGMLVRRKDAGVRLLPVWIDHNGWGSTGVWVGKLVDRNGREFHRRLGGEPR